MNPLRYLSGRKRPEEPPEKETQASGLLFALNKRAVTGHVHIYDGTVSSHTIDKRRAKNKVAKQSRKVNRGR